MLLRKPLLTNFDAKLIKPSNQLRNSEAHWFSQRFNEISKWFTDKIHPFPYLEEKIANSCYLSLINELLKTRLSLWIANEKLSNYQNRNVWLVNWTTMPDTRQFEEALQHIREVNHNTYTVLPIKLKKYTWTK